MGRAHLRAIVKDRAGNILQNAAVEVLPRGTVTIDAAPIDPSTVTGLHTRYDFSDITTLWQDTGLSSAVTSDGQNIAGLTDKTGNGHNATTEPGSDPPTYQAAERNGLSVGNFGGTAALVTSSFTELAQPNTALIVAKNGTQYGYFYDGLNANNKRHSLRNIDAAVIASDPIDNPLIGTWTQGGVMMYARHTGVVLDDGAYYLVDTTVSTDAAFHIWVAEFNGATSKLWGDGTLRASGDAGPDPLTGLTIGTESNPDNPLEYMDGDICEFLLFDRVLTDGERDGVTAYLIDKWGFGAADNDLAGSMYNSPSGGNSISNPLVSDSNGAIEAWFEFPQDVILSVTDNTDTSYFSVGNPISFTPFEVEARPDDAPTLNVKTQYAHPQGNNDNDGLSWASAKADVVSAYDALPGGGTIFIADSTRMDSVNTTNGLWLIGTTDTQVADPPEGWRRARPIVLEGVGGTHSHLATTPQVRVLGGDELDRDKPALWLSSGAQDGFEMRNIRLSGCAVAIKAGVDSNLTERSRDTASFLARNCGFDMTATRAGVGPCVDMGYFFWWTFERCTFSISSHPYTLTGVTRAGSTATFTIDDPNGLGQNLRVGDLIVTSGWNQSEYNGELTVTAVSGVTFDAEVTGAPVSPGTGTDMEALPWETDQRYAIVCDNPDGAPPGIGNMLECNIAGGGALRYHNSGGVGTLNFEQVVQEGSGTAYEPSLLSLKKHDAAYGVFGNFGPWFVKDCFSADTGANQRPIVDIDPGFETFGVEVRWAASSTSNVAPVAGEATVQWQADPAHRQVGSTLQGRYVGPIDAHRRAFAPTAVRHVNLAPHSTATWASAGGTATVTQTKTAPDGTTGAAELSSALGDLERIIYSSSRAVGVGDWVIAGCWVRGTTSEGIVNAPVVASWGNSGNVFRRHSGIGPAKTIVARSEPTPPNQRWEWLWAADIMESVVADPDDLTLTLAVDEDHPTEFYAPVLVHIPAAQGLDYGEVMEYVYNMAPWSDSAAVGSVSMLPNQALYLPKNYIDIGVISAPAAPASDVGRLYVDTSGGKERLVVRFASGAAQVIATEP